MSSPACWNQAAATSSVTLIAATLEPLIEKSFSSGTSCSRAIDVGPLTMMMPRAPLSRASIAFFRRLE